MANSTRLVSDLNETIGSFRSRVDVKVTDVEQTTASIKATADKIYDNVNRFRQDMIKGEEKQIAHENIIRIDLVIKEQFGDHETIRRTMMGIVRDFDINLVRNSTIQELSEDLWITSSRYWLSYAMLAVTAWVNDYPDMARNALAECQRKDAVKAGLFFCLMNMRFGRGEVAKKWFAEYLETTNPSSVSPETAILLQGYLAGVFGKDKELEFQVNAIIEGWVGQIGDDKEQKEKLVGAYGQFIANIYATAPFPFRWLETCCVDVPAMKLAQENAAKFATLHAFVAEMDVDQGYQSDNNYASRIDGILTDLISNYDKEELLVKKQRDYYQCIMEQEGDVGRAETQFEALQELSGGEINIGRQMVGWVIRDDNAQTNVQVRKFAFQNTKEWFKTAVDRWSEHQLQNRPREFNFNIDGWHGVTNGSDHQEQIENLNQYFTVNAFQNKHANTINIALVIAIIASAGLAFLTLYSLIATGLCLAALIYRVVMAEKNYPVRVAAANNALNSCMAELAVYRQNYSNEFAKKNPLYALIESI